MKNSKSSIVIVATALVSVPLFALAAGTWSTKASLQSARSGLSATELNGNVYAAGYKAAGGSELPMEVYNPTANTWSPLPSVGNVSAGVMVTINGKIYYAGGCVNADCNSPTNALRIYDPVANTWTNGAPMPTPRGDLVGGVINGKLYVTTGVSDSSGIAPHPETAIYDPVTNTWSLGAPIPVTRRGASAAVINGKLYVMGGGTPVALLNDVWVYDPVTNTWLPDTPLPQPIAQATASVLNGKIHLIGGGTPTQSQTNNNLVFDPTTHAWTPDALMPTARILLASATAGNSIYAIGGLDTSTGSALNVVEAFSEQLPPQHPATKEDCKNSGFKNVVDDNNQPFKNQGQCVSYVNHHS